MTLSFPEKNALQLLWSYQSQDFTTPEMIKKYAERTFKEYPRLGEFIKGL